MFIPLSPQNITYYQFKYADLRKYEQLLPQSSREILENYYARKLFVVPAKVLMNF